jgi:hypothetical protein
MESHVTFFSRDENLCPMSCPDDAWIGKEGQEVMFGEH